MKLKVSQQGFTKTCMLLCLVFGLSLFAVACGGESGGQCTSSQKYAAVGGTAAKCYDICSADADCGSEERCEPTNQICIPRSGSATNNTAGNNTAGNNTAGNNTAGNNTAGNNTTGNNTTGNNQPGGDNNTSGNNTTGNNQPTPTNNSTPINNHPSGCNADSACNAYCQGLEVDCTMEHCSGSVTFNTQQGEQTLTVDQVASISFDICMYGSAEMGMQGCVDIAAASDEQCQQAEAAGAALAAEGCTDYKEIPCGQNLFAGLNDWQEACGCPAVEKVGAACVDDDQCDGVDPFCLPEDQAGFPGGYCSVYGCEVGFQQGQYYPSPDARCGDTGWCYPFFENSQYGACIGGCETNADCARGPADGYSCSIVYKSEDDTIGWCLPACNNDADCSSETVAGRCNAESYCESSCDPADAASCEQMGGTCEPAGDAGFCVFN